MGASTPSRHALRWSLAAAALLAFSFLAVPAMASGSQSPGADDGSGNRGTVKVDDTNETSEDNANNPHVGCDFNVEGDKMAADHGDLTVKSWPPTGDKQDVLETTWTADNTTGQDANHFEAGPFHLASGHYKVFASNTGGHDKMKAFWVDCPTSAQVPVFPSTMALGMAGLGGIGGSLLILRRKP